MLQQRHAGCQLQRMPLQPSAAAGPRSAHPCAASKFLPLLRALIYPQAQAADPQGFCEPEFHLGITLLNRK